MPDQPLRLVILARDQSPRVQNAWRDLSAFLKTQRGTEIIAADVTDELSLDSVEADLVVVLGGDGAILRACRQMARRQRPILGINLGRLGFLADLSLQEFQEKYDAIQSRKYAVTNHLMFECTLERTDGTREIDLGLNEVAVMAAGSLRMLDIELAIDDEVVTTYSCDGLIVSTPVGSTAHSLSAGGPIIRQELQSFVITPICPHTLTNRPLVDHATRVYTLTVPNSPEGVTVVIDGQVNHRISSGDRIIVRKADVSFQLARVPGHSFYAALHRKLGWGGQPRYRAQ